MDLVEHFARIHKWTTARKTAVLSGAIALPGHLLVVGLGELFFPRIGFVDMALFRPCAWAFVAWILTTFAVSLLVARGGREGRWTYYFFAIPYGALIAGLLLLLGSTTTALFAWYPLVVLLVTLWYDTRIGLFAFVYGVILMAPVTFLPATGAVPFAPLLLDHQLDAQNNVLWSTAVFSFVTLYFAVCLACVILVIKARDHSEEKLDRFARLIRRYVPGQVAEAIMSGRAPGGPLHERRKLSVFFSDLVGFTSITESMEPEDLSRVLNDYFSAMNEIANRHGGTVDELMGDAILIFYGAPTATNDRDHALRAVRMAIEMQAAIPRLNAGWRKAGISVELQARMAVNTGVVTVGDFGSKDRMKYAVLGKHVNLAARVQSICEPGRIWISHATWLLVNESIPCAPRGEVMLKGVQKPVEVYEVLATAPVTAAVAPG